MILKENTYMEITKTKGGNIITMGKIKNDHSSPVKIISLKIFTMPKQFSATRQPK